MEPVGSKSVAHVARMAQLVGRARENDPLWDDGLALLGVLRTAGMVTGGSHPRLRTRGWQALTALLTLAEGEAAVAVAEAREAQ